MKARIGMISQWYDPELGAAAVPGVIARSLLRRGHVVDVVTGFPNYPGGKVYPGYSMQPYVREDIDGVAVHRAPYYPSHDSKPRKRAASYLSFAGSASAVALAKLSSVDAVLVHSTPATVAIPALALKGLRRKPFVVHIEDLWPQTVVSSGFVDESRVGRLERMLNVYCDAVYRHAQIVAVTSPGMANLIASRGVEHDKIVFLPNWSDEQAFRPVPRDPGLAADMGIRTSFTVMYAGNLGEFQGLETLIDAATLLRTQAHIGFVFVGGGVQEERLRRMVTERALTNVSFVRPQPFDRMASVLALGDIQFVGLRDLPLFRATLPSKLQATLAAGRPIIGALTGDAAQAVRDASAGVVVEPGSARLLADAISSLGQASGTALTEYGRAGRAFYETTYSESVVADRLSGLLDDVGGGRMCAE